MTPGPGHAQVPEQRQHGRVPEVVRAYLERALPPKAIPTHVRVEQRGEMRMTPSDRWRPFTAVQEYAADRTCFVWTASKQVRPGVNLRVIDRFDGETGSLEAYLWGVRIRNEVGPQITTAQRIRYLAEIAWNPGAIAMHPDLRWRDLRGRRVSLRCASPDAVDADWEGNAHVEMHFDGHGDPACVTAMRPHSEGQGSVSRPWTGHMWRYSSIEGLRIPTRAEVRWDLPTGPFVYWRAEITSLHILT